MLNLVVIRSPDIDASAEFFSVFGMSFVKHNHGKGPQHYSAEKGGVVFEIYPQIAGKETTSMTRLGFKVDALDDVVAKLILLGAKELSAPTDTNYGRSAVLQEPFGHKIEVTQNETQYRFNELADAHLEGVYEGATNIEEKISRLNKILGGESNFHTMGKGNITDIMKLGCLEYEYLGNIGLIDLTLA